MFERLEKRARHIGADRIRIVKDRIANAAAPDGVTSERTDTGVSLKGKRLRLRFVSDAPFRSFADTVIRGSA